MLKVQSSRPAYLKQGSAFSFELSAIYTPDFVLEDDRLLDDLNDIVWFVDQLTDF